MLHLPTGPNPAVEVDGYSLDEIGERIGRAIARLLRALGEPAEAEPYVRAWIAGLDSGTRSRFIIRVLAPDWPDGSDSLVAAVREGLAVRRSPGH
ncbi:MAG TPA: hypothetical protein VGB85_20880 [Nannocystis sp.]|jgi:hypothetical protein